MPASSWPGTCGSETVGSWPLHACQSLRQMPAARDATTTPSAAGSGSGTVSTESGSPKARSTAALVARLLSWVTVNGMAM